MPAARLLQPELMDDPALDPAAHRTALRGLSRINRFSQPVRVFWPALVRLTRKLGRPLRILDLATGSGDLLLALARRSAVTGIEVELAGCDSSATALAKAQERATAAAPPRIAYFPLNVLTDPLPSDYDVITSTLFLHHLTNTAATDLLRQAATAARCAVLFDDLRRCTAGLLLAQVGTRLLTRSRIVHVDGPRSVRAAFTPAELGDLATRAGLANVQIRQHWPFRQLLTWQRAT